MKAAVLEEVGQPLSIRDDVEPVGPSAGEVRLRIHATGVCHSDLSARDGVVVTRPPIVLGHEGAGEVIGVGPEVVGLSVGDHVIAAWTTPCGHCPDCYRGRGHLCRRGATRTPDAPAFLVGGRPAGAFGGIGVFAQETVVPAVAAIKIPKEVPIDIASLIGCGVSTGVGAAINSARVEPGSTCVVFGCGGVGLCVIQGCRVAGAAYIVGVDPLESKRALAQKFGATHVCAPDDLGPLREQLTIDGFDYAFDVVGGSRVIRAAFDATRRGGTAVYVGIGPNDDPASFSSMDLISERTLRGSSYGSSDVRTDFHRYLRLWETGQLDLESMISRRGSLDDVNEAFRALAAGETIRTILSP
jgi:S-(hydroxymethyl)glutathione dehydrogenase / alcohol dehydrogenase